MPRKKSKGKPRLSFCQLHREGFVHCYDENGRLAWDCEHAERVILTEDLRRYGEGLHIGQLGWTIPEACDGYKWVEVRFDNGVRISVLSYGLERLRPDDAEAFSERMIAEHRGTRFDADPVAAEADRLRWIREENAGFVIADDMIEFGEGSQEVYAFTFPSLKELALLKGIDRYPVKVGFTANNEGGAVARIRGLMFELAGFPERAEILVVCRTADGRGLET
ncbi:MAG: hypothetical protein KF861_10985, partial [Planctomycetaceae bacterium]|nr:hypothetical protein [Planctomycetaceae bacterium]